MTFHGLQKRSLPLMVLAGWLAAVASAPAAPAASSPSVSVVKTDALLSALKAGNYTAAEALFDERMKAAVPMEQLRGTWEGLVTMLGPLVSWTFEAPTAAQSMEQRLGSLRFERGEAKAMVVIDPKTGLVTGFFVRPPSPPAVGHAAYVDTTAFRAVDLKVGRDPYLLGATLTTPTSPGRHPAVVLVHGSGPQDRDETVGANRVFRDLAEGLSSKGIAVLRYDKRTKVYGAKMGPGTSIDEEVVLDAVAAVELLAPRPDVDPTRIFVIGHSLGALLAPEIALRAGQVAGVVALAPPGRPPWDIVLAQMRYLEAPADQIEDIEKKAALLRQGKPADLLGASGAYWLDWAKRDGVAAVKKLGKPVLVLRGDRDFQVGAEDLATWRLGLERQKGAVVRTLPGLNHLFIRGEGKPSPSEYETPGHVDPSVIEMIGTFVTTASSR